MNSLNNPKITNFSWEDVAGNRILRSESTEWIKAHGIGFGPVVKYTWEVAGACYAGPIDRRLASWELLPDASGFISSESQWEPNNCVLLDAYGKERMRLKVPWEMTGSKHAESALAPTSFAGVSAPFINPADGKEGLFGVAAWVERAGKYYFELDYHTGTFLWCRQIRD